RLTRALDTRRRFVLSAPLTVSRQDPISPALCHHLLCPVRMANTKSAKKAARQAARRTIVNKSRRSRIRSAIRAVEEAIASGDRLWRAEPSALGQGGSRAGFDPRSAKGHRASQFGAPKSVSAVTADCKARKEISFLTSALTISQSELWIAINLLHYCHATSEN